MKKWLFIGSLFFTYYAHSLTLTIGSTPQNPPFEEMADKQNNFFGLDIDIMMQVCKRIKAQCTFTPVIFSQLFPQVQAGKIDLAVGGIIITHEREHNFLFSLPYLVSSGHFLTLADSSINTPQEIDGKSIGMRKGTPFKALSQSIYKNITIKEYDAVANALEALKNEEVDAVIINEASAKYWVANNSNLYKLVGTGIPVGDGYGIMANKSQGDLITQINAALLQMEADGTYLSIYSRYFGE